MTKPFAVAELVARIRLRLRTGGVDPGAAAGGLEAGDLRLDVRGRRARCGETVVDLTAREFDLLETFMRHPDQVLSREQLLLHVWNDGVDPASNVVDVFVRTLRGKIGPDRIRTVRGLGYRLEVRS